MAEQTTVQGQAAIDPNAQAQGAQNSDAQGSPAPQGGQTSQDPASQGQSQGQSADDQKMVPLAALHESRERERAIKEELDALRNLYGGQAPGQQYGQRPAHPYTGGYGPGQMTPDTNVAPINGYSKQLEQVWEDDHRELGVLVEHPPEHLRVVGRDRQVPDLALLPGPIEDLDDHI